VRPALGALPARDFGDGPPLNWYFCELWIGPWETNETADGVTNNSCQGMLVWHIRQGHFGDVRLDGFNLPALSGFEGNLWGGQSQDGAFH
jgi:hypothetical protein